MIELIEKEQDDKEKLLHPVVVDGYFSRMMKKRMQDGGLEDSAINSIFTNAYKAMYFFADPTNEQRFVSKILCIGKVQSGKTAFFISTISLAFDNGYDVAYLIGGTKNALRDQNFERVFAEFSNNDDVTVLLLNKTNEIEVSDLVESGKKVVLVSLKNAAINTNLGKMKRIIDNNDYLNSLIIDDEGDEYTPGAPNQKSKKNGKTHDAIVDLLQKVNCATYLSVTATPQANLLISTIDEMSPDYVVLVDPGKGYTGGNAFHDTMDNSHVVAIKDSDDFKDSIPDSFINAIYYFIFVCCLQRAKGDTKPYSMLVHPSAFTSVHAMVEAKIIDSLNAIKHNLQRTDGITRIGEIENVEKCFAEFVLENTDCAIPFHKIIDQIDEVVKNLCASQYNSGSQVAPEFESAIYKIFVGGNMLGRGLTIKNLCVTYIYRESKITAIDTLYQRARWFGYKESYFDICRVYMTNKLQREFVDTVNSENDMWNMITAFSNNNINLKRLPRVFRLDNDSLILTRRSVSKTIVLNRINPGYSYNKSVWFSEEEKQQNVKLYSSFFDNNKDKGKPVQYGTSDVQTHFVIEMTFTDFFNDFLSKYEFPKESNFGLLGFERLLNNIHSGFSEDKVTVVIMRYKTGQYRSLSPTKKTIKELPQSWNTPTQYEGDKFLPGLKEKFHFQIHLVYIDKSKPKEIIPMIAMNNPITDFNVRYVTGDNNYEAI